MVRPFKRRKVNGTGAIDSLHTEAPQCCHKIKCTRPRSPKCYLTALHGNRCPCCPDLTDQKSHACHGPEDRALTYLQNLDSSASEVHKLNTKMEESYEQYQPWTDLLHEQVHIPTPRFDDMPLFNDDLGDGLYPPASINGFSGLHPDHSHQAETPPLIADPSSTTESSLLTPTHSTIPLRDRFFNSSYDSALFDASLVEPPPTHLSLPLMLDGHDDWSAIDYIPLNQLDRQAHCPRLSENTTVSTPLQADVDFLRGRATDLSPFAVDVPFSRCEATSPFVPQQSSGCATSQLVNDGFASSPFANDNSVGNVNRLGDHSMMNQLAAPRYSVNNNTSHPIYNNSDTTNLFHVSAAPTSNDDAMGDYPTLPSMMPSTLGPDIATRHYGLQYALLDDYKFLDHDPNLRHQCTNNIFFGSDPQAPSRLSGFNVIADTPTDSKILYPAPFNQPAALSPVERASEEKGRRDISRDQELLDLRNAGYSYREIKQTFGFKEAESTLRGRYRTLTKHKEKRVRKPEWKTADIQLLLNTVQDHSQASAVMPPSAFRYTDDGLPILHDESHLTKISWKKVAEAMAQQGAYHYGNATVKKKYVQIRNQRLFGIAADGATDGAAAAAADHRALGNAAANPSSGYAEMYTA